MAINNPNGRARWETMGCVAQTICAIILAVFLLWLIPNAIYWLGVRA